MKVSLLISTYNWPQALDLVLKSLYLQSVMPDEVLIADDGSSEETRQLIESHQNQTQVPIRHLWHKDDGFRKSIILNKALAVAEGDFIIQLDGDCMMHKHFIENHLRFAKRNNFLYGSRVNIKREFLPQLFAAKKVGFSFFEKGITKRTRNLHIPVLGNLYRETDELSTKIRGCNFSYWREDFLKVNGYNEDLTGWGKEDSEFAIRLLNSGVSGRRLRYNAIIYHIWHKENPRPKIDINIQIQQRAIDEKIVRCENGVDKYLNLNY